MNFYKYKTIEATMTISNLDEPVIEWGINVMMDVETVTFDQGFREIKYRKSIIKKMDMKVCQVVEE